MTIELRVERVPLRAFRPDEYEEMIRRLPGDRTMRAPRLRDALDNRERLDEG